MNGLNHWWQKYIALRTLVKDYKKENKIQGDVYEVVEHLLKKGV